ncbi:MAG: ATP-binding protein [Planctomycetota bacterium]
MKLSLRWAVVAGVAMANALVFGLGVAWIAPSIDQGIARGRDSYLSEVAARLRGHLNPSGELQAEGFLRWDGWRDFEDVMLVQLPELTDPSQLGQLGLMLNPRGAWRRGVDFPFDEILGAARLATRENRSVEAAGGLVGPVRSADGRLWGGAWVVSRDPVVHSSWLRKLLPWFALSVGLLTAITFVVTDRLLLRPLRRLSAASQHLGRGDFSVRVPSGGRQDELGQLMDTFNSMAAEVEGFGARLTREVDQATEAVRRAEAGATTQRRLAATGELAAGVAHEINNPLGGMLNAVEVLARPDLPEEKRVRYLELVRGGLERIQHIAGGMLMLAPRSPRTGPVQLLDTLRGSLGLVRHRVLSAGAEVWIEWRERRQRWTGDNLDSLLGDLPAVRGQGGELAQCWLNLLVNSLDALAEGHPGGGGQLGLRIAVLGDELQLEFWDDGPGVDEQTLARVADPFFSTKEVGQGTGLGLSFVHQVIDAHGGRVLMDSAPGEGFTVTVLLPLEDARAD